MARLLLDTHAFLWWLEGNRKLRKNARDAIADDANEVLVSAASIWEISTKHRIGKLPGVAEIVGDLPAVVASQAFSGLTISLAHAERAGSLQGEHRDPFDRMLIAQALAERLVLVSNEKVFDSFGVNRLW